MARQHILRFPEGFLWGTASSSYQCEGGNKNSQWYRWEQQGHIFTGEQCGEACNWWEDAEHDFQLAEQMENNALRLSLEWSRIEPAGGQWDSGAVDRYRAMLVDLRSRHLKPIVTLHHFTIPLWFAERGGFADEVNIQHCVRYVKYAVENVQDTLCNWEVLQAAETGSFPPPLKLLLPPIPYPPGSRDFHGVNYFTREMVRFDPTSPAEFFGQRFVRPGSVHNDPGKDIDFGE